MAPLKVRQVGTNSRSLTVPPQHKLKGRCPDGRVCRFPHIPCSQMCSRLDVSAISAGMAADAAQAKADAQVPYMQRRKG